MADISIENVEALGKPLGQYSHMTRVKNAKETLYIAGMLAPGSLTVLVGFAMTLRCPPEIARPALTLAVVGTLLGELVGPRALKHILHRFTSAPPSPPPPRPSLEQVS